MIRYSPRYSLSVKNRLPVRKMKSGSTFYDNIGIFRTLQSHHTIGPSKCVDGRAYVSAEVPSFQGIDSEIHFPRVIVYRVLRHRVFVTRQQFVA